MPANLNTTLHSWDSHSKTYTTKNSGPKKFLKGPIPWRWIERAAALPGSALAVGLTIWRLCGATKSMTVKLASSETEALGVGRSAKSRALSELEKAGLVSVERRNGCYPEVTILDAP